MAAYVASCSAAGASCAATPLAALVTTPCLSPRVNKPTAPPTFHQTKKNSSQKSNNMDKTSWIVVSACVALLGYNFYSSSQEMENKPAPQNALVSAAKSAEPTAAPAKLAQSLSPAQPVAVAPVAAQIKEIASLVSRNSKGEPVAKYVFQNIGGSIKYVSMVGKSINSTKPELIDDVHINQGSKQGIGTLMFGLSDQLAPRYDISDYQLIESSESSVVLQAKMGDLIVRKSYSLRPVSADDSMKEGRAYMLDLDVVILNASTQELEARNWGVFTGLTAPISSAEGAQYTFYVSMEEGNFNKENAGSFTPFFGDDKDRVYDHEHKDLLWAGSMNQYYASLLKPGKNAASNSFYAAPAKVKMPVTGDSVDGVELGLGMPDFRLSPAAGDVPAVPQSFSYTLFTGPKLNMMLNELNDEYYNVDRIMDYGILLPISYSMNWLINIFYGWFGNWGWAIVAMTFVVRLLIWPLYRKSYMSMKRMSLLQPKMKELKEKYPDDNQKVQMEMMKLYKEYGVSPIGGCLPMLLQMPIFFAFFFVLQTAAEFHGASFIGWVHDLSQMDTIATIPIPGMGWDLPINILPIVMAVSMLIQMRMTPQTGDAMQQRIMQFMPLMFFAFCYTYPSALALYWTTQNIISIAQTWFIQRLPMPELQKVVKKPGKKGFLERMVETQQTALAEQQKRAKQEKMRNVTKKK